FKIRNSDRAVGASLAGLIAGMYGREGMPNNKRVRVRFEGEAGQSFGAWCVAGLDLELRGFSQDGVAKGISGGVVTVTLDYAASDYGGELQSVAGDNVGYGATGGQVFIGGRAGHRLGIRNSGATIVAEAAGKYACEYMTRGRVLIRGAAAAEGGAPGGGAEGGGLRRERDERGIRGRGFTTKARRPQRRGEHQEDKKEKRERHSTLLPFCISLCLLGVPLFFVAFVPLW